MFKIKQSYIPAQIKTHQVIEILLKTLDARDNNTFEHSWRVAETATIIARGLKLKADQIEKVHIAAHLHDIGKIGVADKVLNKTGRLTKAEFVEIQKHPQIAYQILKKTPIFDSVSPIVLHHHERFDGRGYPTGLKGKEIPLAARIIAVADSFDAMTSNRSYRRAKSYKFALKEITEHSGQQFCPQVVKVFKHKFELILSRIEFINTKFEKKFVPELVGQEVEHQELPHSLKVYNK
ncbi:HD-GYP domain-containing protein [Halanaerobium praevalens]|uniref:Metal dependent phosphohydrolase n=1 Tax=Halanaerobium praevalens (strain ATCC 33744 / DSM 2228 / GSL) TaxID=572479 RepID=E3DMD7_HALPG|nr:HD-GYP domain-containing protein [Halanaerobium praevalens]ADO76330.1 metal dependent phosphohydrolase [Halanaerobium praevalens DSM 2228]